MRVSFEGGPLDGQSNRDVHPSTNQLDVTTLSNTQTGDHIVYTYVRDPERKNVFFAKWARRVPPVES